MKNLCNVVVIVSDLEQAIEYAFLHNCRIVSIAMESFPHPEYLFEGTREDLKQMLIDHWQYGEELANDIFNPDEFYPYLVEIRDDSGDLWEQPGHQFKTMEQVQTFLLDLIQAGDMGQYTDLMVMHQKFPNWGVELVELPKDIAKMWKDKYGDKPVKPQPKDETGMHIPLENRIFFRSWWSNYKPQTDFCSCKEITEDKGYEPDDIHYVGMLSIGQWYVTDDGCHLVTRIK